MQTRIYVVRRTGDNTGENRLVEATSQAQAIRHVTGGIYTAEVAKTKDLADLMASGAKVEKASAANEAGEVSRG